MRPTLTRLLPIPPLPPRNEWSRAFPTNNFNIVNRLSSPGATAIGKGKRTQVADPTLADSVVRALDVKSDEIVLEAYPGMGFLTRALLALPPAQHPRKVLTIEPSVDFNVNGLGLSPEAALAGFSLDDEKTKAKQVLLATRRAAMRSVFHDIAIGHDAPRDFPESPEISLPMDSTKGTHVFRAFQSVDDPALTIIDGTMFDWKTVPALESQGLFDDVQRREWHDEPPNLHLIAQIPDSDMGEQLVNQWISCVAGQSWLFRWGRVKMSFLVKPTLYDRLTALPGTRAYCKLSVITSALCQVHPASKLYTPGPDSAIPLTILKKREKEEQEKNPGKKSLVPRKTKTKAKAGSTLIQNGVAPAIEPAAFSDPLLSTDPELWYPKPRRTQTESKQPPRPGMMALTIIPRPDPQIAPEDKDVWDYVLRRMFVHPGSPLASAINNLGMGAANLVPKLTNPDLPSDQRIDPEKWIREYTVQDWALIVKAFKEWPFAPDVLVLGNLLDEDNDTRQVGSGM